MFEAKLANASLLRKIIDAIKEIVEEGLFECSESAMSLEAMDPSHVALVSLRMEVGLFDCYRCDRTINLGMSLASMQKALKCANNDDSCMIKFDNSDGDSIKFTFSDHNGNCTQNLALRTLDLHAEYLGIPDQEYSVVCEMPSCKFQKTCRDLAMFSDSLNITATTDGIVFTSKGESGAASVHFHSMNSADDETDWIIIEAREPVNVSFSIKYMNQFTKATSLSSRVRIQLCNGVPVVIEYPIERNGYLRYYMAPKIDDDDANMKN